MPIAPSPGPAVSPKREITYASIRLNAVCSPMPSASGAPKRATAMPSEPDKICFEPSATRGSLARIGALALEAMVGDFALFSQQRGARNEAAGHRIVVAARTALFGFRLRAGLRSARLV